MFRMLCGRGPLAASPNQSPLEKLRILADHCPTSLKTLRPDAPKELVAVVDAMLSTKPSDRPTSAAYVAESHVRRLFDCVGNVERKFCDRVRSSRCSSQPKEERSSGQERNGQYGEYHDSLVGGQVRY